MNKITFRYKNLLGEDDTHLYIAFSVFALLLFTARLLLRNPAITDLVLIIPIFLGLVLPVLLIKYSGKVIIEGGQISKKLFFWDEWSIPVSDIVALGHGFIGYFGRTVRRGGIIIKTTTNIYRINHDLNDSESFIQYLKSSNPKLNFVQEKDGITYQLPENNLHREWADRTNQHFFRNYIIGIVIFLIIVYIITLFE